MDSATAKQYHERKAAASDVLERFRAGESIVRVEFEYEFPGARIAALVNLLRNSHGFNIIGSGARGDAYRMLDVYQWPGFAQRLAGGGSAPRGRGAEGNGGAV